MKQSSDEILAELRTMAKFPKGVPADPTQNMNPEDKAKWDEMNDEHGEKFKQASRDAMYLHIPILGVAPHDMDRHVKAAKRLLGTKFKVTTGRTVGDIAVLVISAPRKSEEEWVLAIRPHINNLIQSVLKEGGKLAATLFRNHNRAFGQAALKHIDKTAGALSTEETIEAMRRLAGKTKKRVTDWMHVISKDPAGGFIVTLGDPKKSSSKIKARFSDKDSAKAELKDWVRDNVGRKVSPNHVIDISGQKLVPADWDQKFLDELPEKQKKALKLAADLERMQRLAAKKTPKDAAVWANKVAKELAKLLPKGTAKFGRVGGMVGYGDPQRYVSLVSAVGGKDHDFVWFKAELHQPGSYKEGHGFTSKGRDHGWRWEDTKESDPKKVAKQVAAKLKSKVKLGAGSAMATFARLYNEYWGKGEVRERQDEIMLEAIRLRPNIVKEYGDFVAEYLRKHKMTDPTGIFVGSLDYNIGEEISKKYFGKTYPDFIEKYRSLVPRGKAFSAKVVLKAGFDKHFGRGAFEEAVKANKKRGSDEVDAQFEKGKPADPTENMSEEDAKKWRLENLKNKDNFKGAKHVRLDKKPAQVLPLAKAKEMAKTLQKSDPDWEYRVVPQGSGKAIIEVYEGKKLLGKWAGEIKKADFRITEKVYDSLRPRQRIWMGIHSTWAATKGEAEFEVGRKSYSKKYDVYSLTLYPIVEGQPNKKGAKWTLFKRAGGDISLAHGDMAAVIKSFRKASSAKEAASGLYGFTKKTQTDCESSIRKLTKTANAIARRIYAKDEKVAPFLAAHSKRAKSQSAGILMSALKELGPKLASDKTAARAYGAAPSGLDADQERLWDVIWGMALDDGTAYSKMDAKGAVEKAFKMHRRDTDKALAADFKRLQKDMATEVRRYWAHTKKTARLEELRSQRSVEAKRQYGMYGYAAKTANLGMQACAELRSTSGHIASDLHCRRGDCHENITGFLTAHAKEAACPYCKMLNASYPDSEMRLASDQSDDWSLTWD
jgi:hypothetical protein